jgi:hypothetical protein
VVKEVSQELFASRWIDVSLLFMKVQVLKKTETEIIRLCDQIPVKVRGIGSKPELADKKLSKPETESYTLIT